MKKSISKIGVFDSGVGGLTVLKELKTHFSGYDFLYLGDTARVPYGIRSQETIQRYAMQDAEFLRSQGAEYLVVACNTATALALPFLQDQLDIPIIGVIEPGVKQALQTSHNKRIGIIATEGTIASEAYQKLLLSSGANVECYAKPTPSLVSFIEEGLFEPQVLEPLLDYYLNDFEKHKIDTLILGCTHYPVIKEQIQNHFQNQIVIVDSAKAVCHDLAKSLPEKSPEGEGSLQIFLTDLPKRSQNLVKRILGVEDLQLTQVKIA